MEFAFRLSPYDQPDLQRQLAIALDKRTEMISRRKYPRIWRVTDWINRGQGYSALKTRWLGLPLLLLGIVLLVPGLMDPKGLTVLLFTGAFATVLGLMRLLGVGKSKADKAKKVPPQFYAAAEKLLSGLQAELMDEANPVTVRFSDECMALGDEMKIPYDGFDAIVQTPALYLLTWQERVTVLQRLDLVDAGAQEFVNFLQQKTGLEIVDII